MRVRTAFVALVISVCAVAIGAGAGGCYSETPPPWHPVNRDLFAEPDEYATDWATDGIYRTNVLMFLVERDYLRDEARYEIVPAGEVNPRVPHTFEEYRRDKRAWRDVRAPLPPGTRIQYKGMKVSGPKWWERYATPLGLILEGDLPNVGLVDLHRLSHRPPGNARFPVINREQRLVEPIDTQR